MAQGPKLREARHAMPRGAREGGRGLACKRDQIIAHFPKNRRRFGWDRRQAPAASHKPTAKRVLAMPYIDSILEPGEQVRYHTTISWTVYAPAIVLAIPVLASLLLGVGSSQLAGVGWFGAIVFALAALVAFVRAWFRRWTTEIVVTDRRIILKRGLIRRHTVEMNMQKVESVDVDQTLLGRIFDYGNVTIRGVGSSFETLRMIDSPLKLRTTVTAS
jgi:membrane protein YdbS with pleckstrin-like domain